MSSSAPLPRRMRQGGRCHVARARMASGPGAWRRTDHARGRALRALLARATGLSQRTTTLLSIAKGADPVTENEFKLFKRAMGEQGSSHSSVADVIANASKKGQLDAWYFTPAMRRVHACRRACDRSYRH